MYIIRPKGDNRVDGNTGKFKAELVSIPAEVNNEYIPADTAFDPAVHGHSGGVHRRDPVRREAEPNAPLPTGNAPRGHTGRGIRAWNSPVTRTVRSGFGKGTLAGSTGVRRR